MKYLNSIDNDISSGSHHRQIRGINNMPKPANPYAKRSAAAAATREKENGGPQVNNNNMGPQSQRRLPLNERTRQLQSQSRNMHSGLQTLFGEKAFDPAKNCAK